MDSNHVPLAVLGGGEARVHLLGSIYGALLNVHILHPVFLKHSVGNESKIFIVQDV